MGQHEEAESCQTLLGSRNWELGGAHPLFSSVVVRMLHDAVTSSALLLTTCLQTLPGAFHLLLLQFQGSHQCSRLFCVDTKLERATANSKDK